MQVLCQKLSDVEIPEDTKKIQILERDELFTYCQKNLTDLVESKNSLIRHHPARFNRKTKQYYNSISLHILN